MGREGWDSAVVKCDGCDRFFRQADGYGERQQACSEECAGPCECSLGDPVRPNPGTFPGGVICPVHGPWVGVVA